MNPWSSVTHWLGDAWRRLSNATRVGGSGWQSLWHGIVATGQALDWVVRNPFTAVAESVQYLADAITGNQQGMSQVGQQEAQWIWGNQVRPAVSSLQKQLKALAADVTTALAMQWRQTLALFAHAMRHARYLMELERRERERSIARLKAFLEKRDLWVLQTVQREAASAYNSALPARLGIVGKLLDDVASDNPLVSGIVSDLATGALDLVEIDDPLVRIVAGKLLSELVDKLAVDKPAGELAQSLLGPILGQPRATDLHNTVGDLAARIQAIEQWQATFMADGGADILQAGSEWKQIGSLLVDAGLLAFFAEWTTNPAGFATHVLAELGDVVNAGLVDAARFLAEG